MTRTTRSLHVIVLLSLAALLGACDPAPAGTDAGPPGTDAGPPGTDAGPTDDAPPAGPTCAAYCTTIMANCTGTNAQYGDMDACLANCDAFPAGGAIDTSGNTLGCRLYHATNAATAAALHCGHAGPSGGAVCGTTCEGYCALALANCTGADEIYADATACATACAAITDDVDYTTAATSGDSLACRIYHLTVAASMPGTHCPHGAEDGGGVCM